MKKLLKNLSDDLEVTLVVQKVNEIIDFLNNGEPVTWPDEIVWPGSTSLSRHTHSFNDGCGDIQHNTNEVIKADKVQKTIRKYRDMIINGDISVESSLECFLKEYNEI